MRNLSQKTIALFALPMLALALSSCAGTVGNNSDKTTVYFETGKHSLTTQAKSTLESLSSELRNEDVAGVTLTGFADRRGSNKANEQLSKRRVHSVKDYLAHKGIKTIASATTSWVGESQSTAVCDDKAKGNAASTCLSPDRKVEITVNTIPALVDSGSNKVDNHANLQGRHRLYLNK